MRIYQHLINQNDYIFSFDCTANTYVSVLNGYIELIKKNCPPILLERNYVEVEWSELPISIQEEMTVYFKHSYVKALNKVNVFKEAIEALNLSC